MTQAGWKWFCTKCGYEHYGERPPKTCPKCGANKEEFYKTPD